MRRHPLEMCSSVSPSSLFLLPSNRLLFRHRNVSLRNSSNRVQITRRSINPGPCLSSSVTERNLELSWFPPDQAALDEFGGWTIVEAPAVKKKKGLPPFLLVGIGTSIAAVLTAIAYFSISKRGFTIRISSPVHALHGILRPSVGNQVNENKIMDHYASAGDAMVPEVSSEGLHGADVETVVLETNHPERQEGKLGRIIIPVTVDSTQQEALLVLKKLKIIEDDVKADELCTRREYSRWLVRSNSLLERNPKHRIVPSVALSGTMFAAFDDVSPEDPDFRSIQSLAEAGIIPSKLSGKNSNFDLDDSEGPEGVYFFAERFISRQDLIDWKVQLEYEVIAWIDEKISRTSLGYMDIGEIGVDASPQLFVDMLAGDKSILRKVFGQAKRFQPNKPSTKAQAAVALTSGRMTEAMHAELSRIEAEKSSRQKEMEEIRSELLNRGDIQRYWDRELEEERSRACEAEKVYLAAIHDLEQEKIVQENTLAEYLKEKAAIECQKQLVFSLKEEIDEMSERLGCEKAEFADQQRKLQDMLSDSQVRLEATLDAKSILEAEIEALQILRSWIEDEARKSQARCKVLEEAGRRWKWDDRG